MKEKSKVIVLFSGGVDSTAALFFYKNQNYNVTALYIDYGQVASNREYRAAKIISKKLKIKLKKIVCEGYSFKNNGEIKGRNAFLLLAGLMKFSNDANILALGVHSGTPYFDCSPAFIKKMQKIFDGYTSGAVQIGAPFLNWNKANIWSYCRQEKIPLSLTYSCELGRKQPCGRCLSCADLETIYATS